MTPFDVGRAEGDTHQAFAKGIQMLIEMHGETARIDNAADFDIVLGKHDAQVAGTPLHVAATWRNRKPESFEYYARGIEVSRCDDGMVDQLNTIVRMHLSHFARKRGSYSRTTRLPALVRRRFDAGSEGDRLQRAIQCA